jgi:hypothetical protein
VRAPINGLYGGPGRGRPGGSGAATRHRLYARLGDHVVAGEEQRVSSPGASAPKEHRTVRRVTSILEAVARHREGVRLNAIVAVLDAPKSSVFGLVKGLVADGYLREQDGFYRLGPAVTALLASPMSPARDVLDVVRPAMDELRATFDETVMWCTRVGDSVVYLEVAESAQLIRYSAPLRTRRPLYPTHRGPGHRAAHRAGVPRRAAVRAGDAGAGAHDRPGAGAVAAGDDGELTRRTGLSRPSAESSPLGATDSEPWKVQAREG